jgi:hypothetical protein
MFTTKPQKTKYSRNASFALTGGQADKICEVRTAGERVVLIITNTNTAGGNTCYISVGEEAASGKGIPLLAGQSVTFSKDAGYSPPQDAIFGYAAAAGTSLAIHEEIEAY